MEAWIKNHMPEMQGAGNDKQQTGGKDSQSHGNHPAAIWQKVGGASVPGSLQMDNREERNKAV